MSVPYGYYPAPKKSNTGKTILIALAVTAGIVVAVLGGCAALIGGGAAVIQQQATDRTADVKITSCKRAVGDLVEVRYTITNSSDTTQTYLLAFDFEAGGVRVGEAAGVDGDVPAGTAVSSQVTGTVTTHQPFTCKVRSA